MASLGTTINPDEIEAGQGFDTFPPCEAVAQIIESDVVASKTGKGMLLNLTWEITEGEHEKRRVWEHINFLHDNPKAQTIGQQQIKAICDAVGFSGNLEDSEVLHFLPCLVKIGIEAGKNRPEGGKYDDRNVIKSVKPLGTAAPAGKPATAAAKPATTATAKPTTAAGNPVKPAAAPAGRPWKQQPAA